MEGNMFTRSFRCSFSAPAETIHQWMTESAGFKDAVSQTLSDGKQKYVIRPGDGTSYAEAVIDFNTQTVELYVSWS
jgi:hypothetical protein